MLFLAVQLLVAAAGEPTTLAYSVQHSMRPNLRRVIRSHYNEVTYCFEQGLLRKPTLADSRVTLHLVVVNEGSVVAASADLDDDKPADPQVTACIVAAASRWHFGPISAGGVTVINCRLLLHPVAPVEALLADADRKADIRACFEKTAWAHPTLAQAALRLRFELSDQGRVRSVNESAAAAPQLVSCIAAAAQRWHFTPSSTTFRRTLWLASAPKLDSDQIP